MPFIGAVLEKTLNDQLKAKIKGMEVIRVYRYKVLIGKEVTK